MPIHDWTRVTAGIFTPNLQGVEGGIKMLFGVIGLAGMMVREANLIFLFCASD